MSGTVRYVTIDTYAREPSASTDTTCVGAGALLAARRGMSVQLSAARREDEQAFESTPRQKLHCELMRLNRKRMAPSLDASRWAPGLGDEYRLRHIEYNFVELERADVRARAAEAPTDADAFLAWFEELRSTGPGQGDPLFPWLEHAATLEQMKWFLAQEMAGEAGFEDLVALTQIKLEPRAKLELARNYWDEMGQGNPTGMHGPMLESLAHELDLSIAIEHTVWEALALGNLMTALAANRHYAYQALGALGVIELTAPGRSAHVNAGLKRLRLSGAPRRYYALHATLDIKHAEAWQREVLQPVVAREPRAASLIAEGALMRLRAGERCFQRYRRELMRHASPKLDDRHSLAG